MTTPIERSTLTPEDRRKRIAALQSMAVLDTPPEEGFDALARLAAMVCSVPLALVSLIDDERVWFKSTHGFDVKSVAGTPSFCAEVANSKKLLEVPDPRVDPRFADHPFVVGQFGMRYYAGAPIIYNGVGIGTVCVLDYMPRRMEKRALDSLTEMAGIAAAMLKARVQAFEMFSNTER